MTHVPCILLETNIQLLTGDTADPRIPEVPQPAHSATGVNQLAEVVQLQQRLSLSSTGFYQNKQNRFG